MQYCNKYNKMVLSQLDVNNWNPTAGCIQQFFVVLLYIVVRTTH
jgi:hypothetical protein